MSDSMLFVAIAIISTVVGQVMSYSDSLLLPFFEFQLVSLLIPVAYAYILRPAQRAINIASGEESGSSNANLTALNWVWMVLGGVIWLGNFAALYFLYNLGTIPT